MQVVTEYRDHFYQQSTQQKKETQAFKSLYDCSDYYNEPIVKEIWGPVCNPACDIEQRMQMMGQGRNVKDSKFHQL